MNWLSSIGIAIIAIIVLAAALVLGWLYVDHLRSTIKTLQTAQQEAVDASKHSSEALGKALADFKRQSDILALQRDRAIKNSQMLAARYNQIMEAKNAAPVDSILCASLVRVYEHPGTSGSQLPVPHTAATSEANGMAQSACKDITQKDVAAWIETQVYPSFVVMQQQLSDLNNYVGN